MNPAVAFVPIIPPTHKRKSGYPMASKRGHDTNTTGIPDENWPTMYAPLRITRAVGEILPSTALWKDIRFFRDDAQAVMSEGNIIRTLSPPPNRRLT